MHSHTQNTKITPIKQKSENREARIVRLSVQAGEQNNHVSSLKFVCAIEPKLE